MARHEDDWILVRSRGRPEPDPYRAGFQSSMRPAMVGGWNGWGFSQQQGRRHRLPLLVVGPLQAEPPGLVRGSFAPVWWRCKDKRREGERSEREEREGKKEKGKEKERRKDREIGKKEREGGESERRERKKSEERKGREKEEREERRKEREIREREEREREGRKRGERK